MKFLNWLRPRKQSVGQPSRPARRKPPTTRLFLEPLEDRTLPSAGWAITSGGTGMFTTLSHISQPDPAPGPDHGDFYVTGYFNGTVTLGNTTLTAAPTNTTSFVAKMDPNGNYLWAEQFGGLGTGFNGIAVDTNGNVYLSGDFEGNQNFGMPSFGNSIPLDGTSPNPTGYICKVDPNGKFQWAHQFVNGTIETHSEALAVDGNGNPYLTWWSGRGTPGEGFLSKYDTNGNLQWTQQLATDPVLTGVSVWCVTVDSSGNAYVGGSGGGPNGTSGFLAEYDTNGIQIGSTKLTSNLVKSDAIYQDPTTLQNYLYTVGGSTGTTPGLQKWEVDGSTLSQSWFYSINAGLSAVAVDTSGNVYLTGNSGQAQDFDPGLGVAFLVPQDGDSFVVKLDSAENFLSVWNFGPSTTPTGLAVDTDNNIYTVGFLTGPSNFDTGSQIVSPPGFGSNTSLFVAKTTQSTGAIFGQVFNDLNGNGVFDPGSGNPETGIPNVTVYLDSNNSSSDVYVAGDPKTTTDSQGYYHFTDVIPGSYYVHQMAPNPALGNFANTPTSFAVTVPASPTLQQGIDKDSVSGANLVFADHTPNNSYPINPGRDHENHNSFNRKD